ncbi:uncharacterized protein LOC132405391 isoform X1 [Hypanus sabinus]|uniref:uncharacterized protein LOC132405391 isoform X1 n=1 Tax=Hypanus sabinus TaxID=79690 RepID=UPI0028C503D1|nr:uncharacterized protein LOC132405391 isoform X1 [Hypanus sabinus]XP_059846140.1 uncharacterized protein LOC132405391 isoform X1 [Hypanus sabinus]XP_059846141.1 uncharacterized protein LOC132405391 isoform X1 [Hypanus sabinus]
MMLSELVLFRLLMVTDSRLNVQDEVCQGQAHDRCYGVCCRAVPSESMLRAREPKAVECKLSSAFNTTNPSRLDKKLRDLGLHSALCSWNLDFLSDHRKEVSMGSLTSDPPTLNTGVPQGCVLSPPFTVCKPDSITTHSSNLLIKFANDTTLVGLISNNNEAAYREEVITLTQWCQENNLSLNVAKTKELIVDYRRNGDVNPY